MAYRPLAIYLSRVQAHARDHAGAKESARDRAEQSSQAATA
jgi:hypothetical protein